MRTRLGCLQLPHAWRHRQSEPVIIQSDDFRAADLETARVSINPNKANPGSNLHCMWEVHPRLPDIPNRTPDHIPLGLEILPEAVVWTGRFALPGVPLGCLASAPDILVLGSFAFEVEVVIAVPEHAPVVAEGVGVVGGGYSAVNGEHVSGAGQ